MRETSGRAKKSKVHWVKLIVIFLFFITASFGLAYLFQSVLHRFDTHLQSIGWLAYLIVFISTLLANLTIIAPVLFATSLMLTAAAHWDPLIVALAAAVGGSFSELSGYYAGLLGKKLAIPESIVGYHQVELWVKNMGCGLSLFWLFSRSYHSTLAE